MKQETVSEDSIHALAEIAMLGPAIFLGSLVPVEKIQEYIHFNKLNARTFLLLRLLTEVQKAGFALHRWNEFLSGRRESPKSSVDSQILDSLVDEQSSWQRKLIEGLVLLINFSETNKTQIYYHFLLCQEVRHYRAMLSEQKLFFSHGCELTEKTIALLVDKMEAVENEIGDLSECWYLSNLKPIKKKNRSLNIFNSLRHQLRFALRLATSGEKTALGYTYDFSYGETSGNIHFNPIRLEYKDLDSRFLLGISQCGLLAVAILQRAHSLAGIRPEGINAALNKASMSQAHSNSLNKKLVKGDYVISNGPYLGEVIDVANNIFDYKSYRVRYLDDTPLEGIDEAWFPAPEVHLFIKGSEIRDRAKETLQGKGLSKDTESRLLREAARRSVLEVWKGGISEYYKTETIPTRIGYRGLGYKPL